MADLVSLLATQVKNIKFQPLDEEGKAAIKSLIRPGIKYVFASGLNRFTGEKFQCLRNWQERSGKALWQSVNDAFSPIINEKLQQIKSDFSEKLEGVKGKVTAYAQGKLSHSPKNLVKTGVDFGFEKAGLDQSLKVTKTFVEIACDLLSHTEEGVPQQTVTRLLTIVGVLYTGNEDFKEVVDDIKGGLFKEFFKKDGILSQVLKSELGKKIKAKRVVDKLAGLVEKLVISLNVQKLVNNFVTHRILENRNSQDIVKDGDVYEKLILKGVSTFVEIKGADGLSLEELLNDKKFSKTLREKLQELQGYYNDSKLTQVALWGEKSLVTKLFAQLKDKDILHLSNDELKKVLWTIGKEYVDEGIEEAKSAVKQKIGNGIEKAGEGIAEGLVAAGTAIGTGIRYVREGIDAAVDAVKEKGADLAKKGLDATAVGLGTAVGTTYRYVKEGVCWLGSLIGLGSGKTTPEADSVPEGAKSQDKVPVETNPAEASAGVGPAVDVDVDPVTAVPAREVSVRESDVPVTVKGAKTKKPESKSAEVLAAEKELEEDFGEYLQALFKEESKAESPKPEIPKTVGEQNGTATLESKSVEQKEEKSTGVMDAMGEVVAEVVKGTGKVAWWCFKGLCSVAAAAATGVYNCVAGSSAESEPGKVAQKTEAEVPKGSAPESQTAQSQRKSDIKAVEE